MQNHLTILPFLLYSIGLEWFRVRVTSKKPSYPSYPSYLPFFVHISPKKVVYNSAILYTPPDPYTKKNSRRFQGFLGKERKKVRCLSACYPSPKLLIHIDKLTA